MHNDVKAVIREQKAMARPELPGPRMLRAIRQSAGLTQEQVAEAVGCSASMIAKFEQGRTVRPERDIAHRYAEALHEMASA
jgi:transcriptional regulator with XRE-family HTH domain